MTKWISIAVGLFSLVGVLVGAGISYGQHMAADRYQDDRLTTIEMRVHDLERAMTFQHGDVLPHAAPDKEGGR